MERAKAAEFNLAALAAKPQTSCLGTGDMGIWEELTRDREGERAGLVSINADCQEMRMNHISWAPRSHLDTGTEVFSRALAIFLSRPHTYVQ